MEFEGFLNGKILQVALNNNNKKKKKQLQKASREKTRMNVAAKQMPVHQLFFSHP